MMGLGSNTVASGTSAVWSGLDRRSGLGKPETGQGRGILPGIIQCQEELVYSFRRL